MLIEIGNTLSVYDRAAAALFIAHCYETPNVRVISVDTSLLRRALALYQGRQDKDWGLTDCISFVVMEDQGLTEAVTTDMHFRQAGYRALLLHSD